MLPRSIKPFGHNKHGPKVRGLRPLFGEDVGPHQTQSLRHTSIPSGILVHPAVWPQRTLAENWGLCPFRGEGAGSPSNTSYTTSPGTRPTFVPSGILIHPAVWPQQTWAENWGLCPLGGGAVSPSNTIWPRLSHTFISSFILIRPTVWPQNTNVTDRTGQDRTDRTTV